MWNIREKKIKEQFDIMLRTEERGDTTFNRSYKKPAAG